MKRALKCKTPAKAQVNFRKKQRTEMNRSNRRVEKKEIFVWTTRDGREIPVNKMEDQHLVNSIKMLERNAKRDRENAISGAYSICSFLQGEMATMDAENAINYLELDESEEDFLHPAYEHLVKEANRRKLDIS